MRDGVRRRLLVWIGFATAVALLLPNHYSPWVSSHQEFVTALAFLPLLLWASWQDFPVSPITVGVGLMALVPLVQIATGHLFFAGDGWLSALYLLAFAFAIHAGSVCIRQAESHQATFADVLLPLWLAFIFAALISVGIAMHQWLELGRLAIFVVEMPPGGRPFGNLAQPNQLATLLLLGMMGVMYLWELKSLRASIAMLAALILVFGLVMTGSRTVLLVAIWIIPAYGFLRRRCSLRTTPGALLLCVAVFVLMSQLWQPLNHLLLLPSGAEAAVGRVGDAGSRKMFWFSMMDAIGRAPWAGYGWGQVSVAQTATALDYPAIKESFESAHNLLLDLLLWNGVLVGGLAVGGLLLWFAWQMYRCADAIAWVTLAAIGVVFSHAMVEYPLNYAYFLLPVGFLMGGLGAHNSRGNTRQAPKPTKYFHYWIPSLAGLTALLFLVVLVEYLPYEENWRAMRFQEARIGDMLPTEPPPTLLLTNLHALLKAARQQAEPGMLGQDVEGMRQVSERYAYPSLMFKYALAQALNHQPEGAQSTLRRLCKMQKIEACTDANRQWAMLARQRYPHLTEVRFPEQ